MREVVICDSVRTPIGKFGGSLRDISALDLGVITAKALVQRNNFSPEEIDEVILGQGYNSMDAPCIGRAVAQDAGFPDSVTGMQVDRRCGSGIQAVIDAAMQIQTGVADLILAGGTESMSAASFYTTTARWGANRQGLDFKDSLVHGRIHAGGVTKPIPGGMIETAENLRREFGISREDQDELAVRSHRRAAAAVDAGKFDDEIVPVPVKQGKQTIMFDKDEHLRPDASVDSLAKLKPMRGSQDPDATVTAGNSSGQNDAAAMVIVTTPEKAHELGLTPRVRLVSWALAGLQGHRMGLGPVESSRKALARAGLELKDMDLIELNEAFAAQVLACTRSLGLGDDDHDRINVNGSGISLGHPVGATGARILANLSREMQRRDARYGLETMCIGGGQGIAVVFENFAG
ncbi:Acetyl-CoA acetyltransferase [Corynebacterium occultum]|uniref:Probable acetyl-CoA acetyltransferase n=1 Tax=Corynebacterium occultum TaxID=2675219 RepID=A0A6B8W105_9CORY|nr:acetyl-CoA C-acetyltransferase [Corynebacterium occultum]QGU06171.1 Acetyl-CoA acetyltransferase [Corynebacterium occultum]